MSNVGKFRDPIPFIKNAGKTLVNEDESTLYCVQPDIFTKHNQNTPEGLKRFRKLDNMEPGKSQIHYGKYFDNKSYENLLHGVKSKMSLHVSDCIKGSNLQGMQNFINEIKEGKYASHSREPLGRSLERNYKFPAPVQDENFYFGRKLPGRVELKEFLYNPIYLKEKEEDKKRYLKTHGLCDPGYQKDREYNWPVDKWNYVFGKSKQEKEINGTEKSLKNDCLESMFPKTVILDKRYSDFKTASSDVIGRSKFKGALHHSIDDETVFGKIKKKDTFISNAATCINGDPSLIKNEDCQPEPDLGKSVKFRSKLKKLIPTDAADPKKIFGLPSIRNDLHYSSLPSIANMVNFGSDPDAYELLYPNANAGKGLTDKDFNEYFTRDEIKDFVIKGSYDIPKTEFDFIFDHSLSNNPNPESKVTFKNFLSSLKYFKKEFERYTRYSLKPSVSNEN